MAGNGWRRRQQLIAQLGLICPDCGREMIDDYKENAPDDRIQDRQDFISRLVTIDHIVPRARGGKNGPDNLRLCCLECNKIKGSFYLADQPNIPVSAEMARLQTFVRRMERRYERTSEDAEWSVRHGGLRLTREVSLWLVSWRRLLTLLPQEMRGPYRVLQVPVPWALCMLHATRSPAPAP